MVVSDSKSANLNKVKEWCENVCREDVDLICLPEMFNCPYDTKQFPAYAEPDKGETWQLLSELAGKHRIYVLGGSIPEIDEDRYYNTSYLFDREGREIGKHRKMHLFDVNIAGGQYFKESDILSAGDQVTVVNTEFGGIGIAICYDIRFPELLRLMVLKGADYIFIPAAFNMTTGPAHWEITFRARALDNQVYLFGTSSARNTDAGYHAYGHSLVVSPWGEVLAELDEKEGSLVSTIDRGRIGEIREQLPLLKHRRQDVYELNLR